MPVLLFGPTAPTPLLMEPLVALVDEKVRVELWPEVMVAGEAAKLAVGTGGGVLLLLDGDDPPQPANPSARLTHNAKHRSRVYLRHKTRFPMTGAPLISCFPMVFLIRSARFELLGESNSAAAFRNALLW
jgi:hypothetical protein